MSQQKPFNAIVLFSIILFILLCRDSNILLFPVLYYEDGNLIFAYYYNHREIGSLLRSWGGGVLIVPNLLGYASIWFPTRMIPCVLAGIPLLFSAFVFSLIYHYKYRRFISSDKIRFAVAIVLALFPIGNHPLISNTQYTFWSALVLLFWLSLFPFPKSIGYKLLQFFFMGLLICSHPATIILVPVYLGHLCQRPTRANFIIYTGLILLIVLYQILGVNQSDSRFSLALINLDTIQKFLELITNRVIFEGFFGSQAWAYLILKGYAFVMPLFSYALIFLTGVVLYQQRKKITGPNWFILGMILYLIGSFTFLIPLGRSHYLKSIFHSIWAQRYFYVQRIFLLLFYFYLFSLLCNSKAFWNRIKALVVIIGVCYLGVINYYNNDFYQVDKASGLRIRQFFKEVEQIEQDRQIQTDVKMKLKRADWDIEITIRKGPKAR